MMLLLTQHKARFIFFAALACLLLASVSVRAQQIPEPTGNAVNDFANIIDASAEQRLEQTLINLKRQQNMEFGVVTVKTTGGQDIFDYTLAVGRKWKIGPNDDSKQGLLLLIAVDDRKYFTLVSRHLQGELPDGVVGSIQRQYLVPAFRAGDYGKGITDTIRAYIDRLAAERGFSTTGIYPQESSSSTPPRSQQPTRRTGSNQQNTLVTCCIIVIVLIILIALSRGGGGSGCLNLLFLGSLFSGGGRGWGDSGSGWGSGGWSGGGGGDGGGFGGFGGGGDFDGGGAGGSW